MLLRVGPVDGKRREEREAETYPDFYDSSLLYADSRLSPVRGAERSTRRDSFAYEFGLVEIGVNEHDA